VPSITYLQKWGISVAIMGNFVCNFVLFHSATNTKPLYQGIPATRNKPKELALPDRK
jgi:hypothetical protein